MAPLYRPDPAVGEKAREELLDLGKSALPWLEKAASGGDAALRERVAVLKADIEFFSAFEGPYAGLLDLLAGGDPAGRARARRGLLELGGPALPHLRLRLDTTRDEEALESAALEFRVESEGGEAVLKKSEGKWILKTVEFTWIE